MPNHPLVRNIRRDPFDVYVGRPSKWGNPFRLINTKDDEERARVLARYRRYLKKNPDLLVAAKKELRGKTLGCFCAPKACHADVLAEVANDDL